MKKKLIRIFFDIPIAMTAGVGLFKLVHQIFSPSEPMPSLFILLGLFLGLLIYKIERETIIAISKQLKFSFVKLYIYMFSFFIYVASFFGILEVINYFLVAPNLGFDDLISWKLLLVLLPFVASWLSTVDMLIDESKESAKQIIPES